MIRANSILGIVSITSFMLQILCFSTKEGAFFPCSCVAFLPRRCRIRRNATPSWLFFDKKLLFLWYFTKWWLCSIWVILCCICRVEVSPFCRRTAFFCLEDSVKMSATRESTLGWNDVVAIIWIFQHHLFCSVETYLAEPYSEVRMQALIEKQAQFVLWYTKCTRKRQHVYITILIAQIHTPLVKTVLNKVSAILRQLL